MDMMHQFTSSLNGEILTNECMSGKMPVKIEDGRIELKIDLGGIDCGDVTWI